MLSLISSPDDPTVLDAMERDRSSCELCSLFPPLLSPSYRGSVVKRPLGSGRAKETTADSELDDARERRPCGLEERHAVALDPGMRSELRL